MTRSRASSSSSDRRKRSAAGVLLVAALLTRPAEADVVVAEPADTVQVPFPDGAPHTETQVVLQLVVAATGEVESAVEVSRAPASSPSLFAEAAVRALKAAKFRPSSRDGQPIRSRIEYVVVFHPPPDAPPPESSRPAPPRPPSGPALSTDEQDEDYAQEVIAQGVRRSSARGLGDTRVKRELLDASPRMQTSEMLSAAPGFFVDHEDGEGLGNDVFLRGFDLEHGSGIEMRIGSIPLNIPTHIHGQGYADVNFIIPEIVRSVRVLEGPYDPRQGDAAIVGSAYFDLGVVERGYQAKLSHGSFNQTRVVGVAAPEEADEETLAAFSIRKTDGFGSNRAAEAGAAIAQYAVNLGPSDRLRFLATAHAARGALPGVVRRDDVDAGRIDYYGSYPQLAGNQGVQSSRVILGADFDHVGSSGAHFEFAPWAMWTGFRSRQNFTGNLESSQIDPRLSARGDLFETTNVETAIGLTSRFHARPISLGTAGNLVAEPGVQVRAGRTDQTKNLLDPVDGTTWDRRIDAGVQNLDAGAYVDLDARLFERLRLSGGVRADVLALSIDDHLAGLVPAGAAGPGSLPGARREALGVVASPRATAELEVTPWLSPVVSFGEGFRSLDAGHLGDGATHPYSKVRSFEGGARAQTAGGRYSATVAAFQTDVGNELVFEAVTGGLETENASTRRGVIGSLLVNPVPWLLASSSLTVTRATFATQIASVAHYVPNVPPVVLRVDATIRGALAEIRGKTLRGRAGVGYTFLGRRYLTDAIQSDANHVVNVGASLRYDHVEIGLDAYNLLGLRYADEAEVYVSNWSLRPGQQPASSATHITAAAPRTVLGTISLYF